MRVEGVEGGKEGSVLHPQQQPLPLRTMIAGMRVPARLLAMTVITRRLAMEGM